MAERAPSRVGWGCAASAAAGSAAIPPLPARAADIGCASWPQLLLKFVLSHPAVTCVIPGTQRREHMQDNLGAGFGNVPDAAFWRGRERDVLG